MLDKHQQLADAFPLQYWCCYSDVQCGSVCVGNVESVILSIDNYSAELRPNIRLRFGATDQLFGFDRIVKFDIRYISSVV